MSKTDKTKPMWVKVNEMRVVDHDHSRGTECNPTLFEGGRRNVELGVGGCSYSYPVTLRDYARYTVRENDYKHYRRRFRQSLRQLALSPDLWDDFDYSDRKVDHWLEW